MKTQEIMMDRKNNAPAVCGGISFSAQEWIRTITPLQALRPEHSASTNFATWALIIRTKGLQR